MNISKIKSTTIIIKLKNSSRQKNPAKPKTSGKKDFNNSASLTCFEVLEEKEIDEKNPT